MNKHETLGVQLEREAAVARAAAITAEKYGYVVAVLAAVLVTWTGAWILSIPLAAAGYIFTVRPYHKAVERADEALQRHADSTPITEY